MMCFVFVFLPFLEPLPWHMEVPRLGCSWSCSRQPTPEPQPRRIRAASATYTTAHSNARSLTHWARAGTEPATSWFLVGFVNHCATTRTPTLCLLIGAFSPLTLKVIIDKYVFIAILNLVFQLILCFSFVPPLFFLFWLDDFLSF